MGDGDSPEGVEPERTEVVYVTPDSAQWARLSVPFGLVSPPMIDLHQLLRGPVRFYHADSYKLPVPPDARREPGDTPSEQDKSD